MAANPEAIEMKADTDGVWREAAERFEIAAEAEARNRTNGIEAKRFRWGDQWPDDMANRRRTEERPALTINHTTVVCQRQENVLRQQRPRIKVHPVSGGASIENAKIIQGLIRQIENRSFASIAYDGAAKSALDVGWGYFRIRADYVSERSFDQELLIEGIRNCFRVYMDPTTQYPDGRDQGWCLISDEMKRAEYRRKYKGASNSDYTYVEGVGDAHSLTWENKETIRLAEYYRIHQVNDTLTMLSDGRSLYSFEMPTEEFMLASGLTVAVDLKGDKVTRKTTRREVQWFKLNGRTVIDQKKIPGRYIPVIRVDGNTEEIEGQILKKGMVKDLMDPARMYNYWRTAQTERYALSPKAPWVAAEGQTDDHPEWSDANRKSYSVLVYKPVVVTTTQGDQVLPPPQRQPPTPIEEGMAAAAAGAEHDLMAVSGMPQENPEVQARIIGGNKYLQRRQGMQDLTHYQYYDNQTLAIAWAGCVLLELIPYYYDNERAQQIIGEDEQPKMITLNQSIQEGVMTKIKNDVKNGVYSVVMDTGPDYMTARQEGAENMIETLNTPLGPVMVEQGADLILRNMDWHGADQLADRVAIKVPGELEKIMAQMPDQAKNIIQSLQQQLAQATQTIQAQALEIKYKANVEKMKVDGKLEDTDRNSETKIRIESMKGATARDVAEIHGAAQLLNSQMESREEEKAADRMIKAGTTDRTA